MKKVKWAILIIISILIIFVLGVLFYIFVGENADTKATKKEVEGMTNAILQEIASKLDDDNLMADSNENSTDKDITSQGIEMSEKDDKGGIAQKQGPNITAKEKQILSIYDAAFYELQASANGIVDGLLTGIKSDYTVLKDNNEASLDKVMMLGASYSKRANALESQVDSSVNTILSKMETDMTSQGISSDKIKAYKQAYEAEYEIQKETRRNAVTNKAQEFM
ncbi:hypothetical protein Ami103574_07125 [Aminipila butyrica]|uniref:Uncharacterized protein n=1 Tax=Aminipila butyrica TaxID=433296 RepID=A0A858BYF4_9FIRM|nr:hypothetical protein [Aminipila butyrica]QIB69106.1 hypothetical protein Ami103574_07125 [Aminipila butyrica]